MKKLISMMTFSFISLIAMGQTMKAGINPADLDRSASPSSDFYQYACGGWIKSHPLPAAYARFGSFDELQQNNDKRINAILTELLKNNYTEGSLEKKLSDLYKLAMDSTRQNKDGVGPVMKYLTAIEKSKSKIELFGIEDNISRYGMTLFYNTMIGADSKSSKENIFTLWQGGLSLGQKEYYLDTDSATISIRNAFKKHIVNMFKLFGFNSKVAQQKMKAVMNIETALAKVSKSAAELRDDEANYNKMTFAQIEKDYPNIRVRKMLQTNNVDIKYAGNMIVGQPLFFKGANTVAGSLPLSDYKAFMEWNIISMAAPYLGDKTSKESFNFSGKVMRGRKEDFPTWKKAVDIVQSLMGEALGKIYVEKYFPASSKQRMEQLVVNLQKSLAERIKAQDWMSDSTKANALDKLAAFYVKIGYPNKWKDYGKLKTSMKDSYFDNILNCMAFVQQDYLEKRVGKPVDKDVWDMTPQTVNAYYNPTTNEICFPAGILQPPFFDETADDAFNYGAIGVVIGHEMTHGFDDQGRHYDKDGNMKEWWTASDAKNFTERVKVLSDYFSKISVLPDLKANGVLTLGENLADHGGLQVSFNAFKEATKNAPLGVVDGYTPEQRFFLAFAGVWSGNITEKEIRNRTKSDPHSLSKWRVNGSLPHIDVWYDAFNIKPGDGLYIPNEKRLSLW